MHLVKEITTMKPRGPAVAARDLETAAVTRAAEPEPVADIRVAAGDTREAAEATPEEDGPAAGSVFRGSAASAFLAWAASAETEAEPRPLMRARFAGRALVRFLTR